MAVTTSDDNYREISTIYTFPIGKAFLAPRSSGSHAVRREIRVIQTQLRLALESSEAPLRHGQISHGDGSRS